MLRRCVPPVAIAIFVAASWGVCWAGDRGDYLPLDVGMTWTYGDTFHVVRVKSMMKSLPPIYVVDYTGQVRNFIEREKGKVLEWGEGKTRLLYDFEAPEGASWKIESLGDGSDLLDGTDVTVLNTSEAVKVPFGAFNNCVHFGMRPRPGLADAGVTDMWFAPDVGMIKWTEIWIGGVRSFELTAFSGNGPRPPVSRPDPVVDRPESYPNVSSVERDGMRYEVATERPAYDQGDVVSIRYRATAIDRDSVAFRFGTTQQEEFLLVNSENRKVWVWSDGKAFGEALTWFTLGRGESKEFEAALQLSAGPVRMLNIDQASLSPGTYRLIGFLPTMSFETVDRTDTEIAVTLQVLGDLTQARLAGEVVEARNEGVGRPIVEARVSLKPLEGSDADVPIARGTFTNRSGLFSIPGLKPGTYRLTAEKKGYRSVSAIAELQAGENRLDFALEPESDEQFPNSQVYVGDRLWAEIATDRLEYRPTDSVIVRYRLINTGPDSLKLTFRSGQRYDFLLEGSRGRIWGWSDGRAFILALGAQDLAPGDSVEVRKTFGLAGVGATAEGTYALDGFMTVTPDGPGAVAREETGARVKFSVVSPNGSEMDPAKMELRGDFNLDRSVDFDDFFRFALAFGTTSTAPAFDRVFDLDGNGGIDFDDFMIFAASFGSHR